MQQVSVKGQFRDKEGKEACKKYRAQGLVPGVIYGKNFQNVSVLVDALEMRKVLTTKAGSRVIINLEVEKGGKKETYTTMVNEIQRDIFQKKYVHVDLQRIALDEIVHTEVPVKLTGEAKGVKNGGILEHLLWTLSIEGLPLDIPESIVVDVTNMEEKDQVLVKDLKLAGNVKILAEPEDAIALVHAPRVVSETAAAAEGQPAAELEAVKA